MLPRNCYCYGIFVILLLTEFTLAKNFAPETMIHENNYKGFWSFWRGHTIETKFAEPMNSKSEKSKHKAKCIEYHRESEKDRRLSWYPSYLLEGGGPVVRKGEFPHTAAIGFDRYDDSSITEWNCGGTLISDEYVLTAAHCSHNGYTPAKYVRLGTINVRYEFAFSKVEPKTTDFLIKHFIQHPGYDGPKMYNDIALIQLDRTVTFGSNIRPACLWSSMDFNTNIATAIGYGLKTSWYSSPEESKGILQKITINILTNDECKKYARHCKTTLPHGIQSDKMFCAKDFEEKQDTCQGDSGSPMQIKDNSVTYIIGVTSFGKECGKGGVYTRVSNYIQWIEDIVWE